MSYIVRRVLWLIPVLFVVSVITFGLMHAVPGGPFDREKNLRGGVIARLNEKYGLDKPVPEQYVRWVSGLIRLDLGPSYRSENRTVNQILAEGIPRTVQLGLMAFALAVPIGIFLGIVAALGHNRWPDYVASAISLLGIATPNFVLAVLLVILFSVILKALPPTGWRGPETWIMPVLALAIRSVAEIARYTRASMLEVTRRDYIRTAYSKGLRDFAVVLRHMIRNALIPVITILGPILAFLITGSFIIEYFFGIPGAGRLFVQSIQGRDYAVIMAAVMLYAFVIAVLNLVVDILYAYIDPRIRYS
ncbi:MAG TPA: ABC transporter permease [Candidatus Limnocylindrales bacterium]|nr:ABC transporter permease [Candidatus Limnocylindrales bacterium]